MDGDFSTIIEAPFFFPAILTAFVFWAGVFTGRVALMALPVLTLALTLFFAIVVISVGKTIGFAVSDVAEKIIYGISFSISTVLTIFFALLLAGKNRQPESEQ